MPIRFRCAYCNQLLGISRRKAGTVVRCPTCAGQVVVPNVETETARQPAGPSNPFVFERSDFEELLNPEGEQPVAVDKKDVVGAVEDVPRAAASEPPGAWGTHAAAPEVVPVSPAERAPEAVAATAEPAGLVLSPVRATLLAVVVVVLLAVAFLVGVCVGYYLRGVPEVKPESKASGVTLAAIRETGTRLLIQESRPRFSDCC
jgi:hypothetical protein